MALPLPKTFIRKKRAILLSLSTPLPTYTDASPKGSVDTAILPLIDQINSYEGLVTTSSCAGRVSVFLEGHKSEAAVGGKGSGNKWLFVSHEPLDLGPVTEEELRRTFGLASGEGVTRKRVTTHDQGQRLVRFQFEPMILHIMTASLKHAQPVLAAAINAGFRESGVQSLRNLDDSDACPMVAIRTAGLALESVVGVVDGEEGTDDNRCRAIVGDEYLRMLVGIANERFAANTQRMERLQCELSRGCGRKEEESKEERRWRKRAEGLERKRRKDDQQSNVSTEPKSPMVTFDEPPI